MNRGRRIARQSSNIFAEFTQHQILELKGIFNMLDSTADGNVSREDLVLFLETIGAPLTPEEIDGMMEEMGERFNFTLFLTTLCEKFSKIESEKVLVQALQVLDQSGTGKISLSELREALLGGPEPVTKEEWRTLEKQLAPVEGKVSISEIARTIKYCGLPPTN